MTKSEGRQLLDLLRQVDNYILFDLKNPKELDSMRGVILKQMHRTYGLLIDAEKLEEQERNEGRK